MEEEFDLHAARSEATNILKAEMKRRGLTGRQLAILMGEPDPEGRGRHVLNAINRGSFSFVWAVRALRAMQVTHLDLRPVSKPRMPLRTGE